MARYRRATSSKGSWTAPPGSIEVLEMQLASIMPNLISVAYNPSGSANELHATVRDIKEHATVAGSSPELVEPSVYALDVDASGGDDKSGGQGGEGPATEHQPFDGEPPAAGEDSPLPPAALPQHAPETEEDHDDMCA